MSSWNGNRFSVYTSEEKTTLGLIKEVGEIANFNNEKIKEIDNKKVSVDDMENIYKIDKNGNFVGSWFGIKKPTQSNEGLSGAVEQLLEQVENIENKLSFLDKMKLKIVYGAKGDGVTDDSQAVINCIANEDIIYFPSGNYKLKNITIKESDKILYGSPKAKILNDVHCFILDPYVQNIKFYNMKFVGNLKYAEIIGVDSLNSNKIKLSNNLLQVGEQLSGSNIYSIGQMDTKRANILSFDGEYYETDLKNYGFDGNYTNKIRQYFPQYVGNFEWTSCIRGNGFNDGLEVVNCEMRNQRGYFIQYVNTSNVKILNNIFDTCGMDMFNFGLNTVDIKNLWFENNICRNQINFAKQGIYLSSKSNRVSNLYFKNNIIEKITESFLSFFYSDCVFDNVLIEGNRFTDVDLYAIAGAGENFKIINNVFETKDFKTSDNTSYARTCIDIGYYLNSYVPNLITDYKNIIIEGNTFNTGRGIYIRQLNNNNKYPKNLKIKNNYINVISGGVSLCGEYIDIKENIIISNKDEDTTAQWCGLYLTNYFNKVKVSENVFDGETRIRLNKYTTPRVKVDIYKNRFEGNYCITGGLSNVLQNNDTVELNFYNNDIVTTNVQLNTCGFGEYYNNRYIYGNTIYDIPFVRNLMNQRYATTNSSLTESWRDSTNTSWLPKFYKLGDKFYKVDTLTSNKFYGLKNDLIYDGNTFKYLTTDGFLTT